MNTILNALLTVGTTIFIVIAMCAPAWGALGLPLPRRRARQAPPVTRAQMYAGLVKPQRWWAQ